MDLKTFVIYAIGTSLACYVLMYIIYVFPAWKRARLAESLAILTRCLRVFNQDHLLNGKIKHGDYLHDKFYRFLSHVVRYKVNLNSSMLEKISYDEIDDAENKRLNSEIEALDPETKDLVLRAFLHLGVILFLRNPWITIRVCLRTSHQRKKYRLKTNKNAFKERMANTAGFIALKGRDEDYNFIHCRV